MRSDRAVRVALLGLCYFAPLARAEAPAASSNDKTTLPTPGATTTPPAPGAPTEGTTSSPPPAASAITTPGAPNSPPVSVTPPNAPNPPADVGGAPIIAPGPDGSPAPAYVGYPGYVPAPIGVDVRAADQRRLAERRALVSRAEIGGIFSQGLDATDTATRAGGFYASGSHAFAKDFVFAGRYAFAAGNTTERLPGNKGGQFGVPNDVDVLETRHAFDLAVGYTARLSEGPIRFWAMPLIGPRLSFFVNDVASRTAFEAEFGGRAGIWGGDKFEMSLLLAYAPAVATTHALADVQGPVRSELRFGAGTNIRVVGPLGFSLAYEGDVVTLSHQKLSSHGLFTGLSYAFE